MCTKLLPNSLDTFSDIFSRKSKKKVNFYPLDGRKQRKDSSTYVWDRVLISNNFQLAKFTIK